MSRRQRRHPGDSESGATGREGCGGRQDRLGEVMRKIAVAIALVSVCALVVRAQQSTKVPYSPPKTAWGDPDLQGIWPSTDMVGVPFERPENLGERNEVTQDEFESRLKQ